MNKWNDENFIFEIKNSLEEDIAVRILDSIRKANSLIKIIKSIFYPEQDFYFYQQQLLEMKASEFDEVSFHLVQFSLISTFLNQCVSQENRITPNLLFNYFTAGLSKFQRNKAVEYDTNDLAIIADRLDSL